MGFESDPITGTKQAALRQGSWKLLVGNPSQNPGQNGWKPPPTWEGNDEGDETTRPSASRRRRKEERAWLAPDCEPCTFTRANLTTGVCLFNVEADPEEVSGRTVWDDARSVDRSTPVDGFESQLNTGSPLHTSALQSGNRQAGARTPAPRSTRGVQPHQRAREVPTARRALRPCPLQQRVCGVGREVKFVILVHTQGV